MCQAGNEMQLTEMFHNSITITPRTRMRAALILALAADALQVGVFPLFAEGAASPADDILDFCVSGAMIYLLGWHWEFLPSFFGKLVPGVDVVPFWTLAVANVYRKSKRLTVTIEPPPAQHPALKDPRNP
jgi:hypothetical protein